MAQGASIYSENHLRLIEEAVAGTLDTGGTPYVVTDLETSFENNDDFTSHRPEGYNADLWHAIVRRTVAFSGPFKPDYAQMDKWLRNLFGAPAATSTEQSGTVAVRQYRLANSGRRDIKTHSYEYGTATNAKRALYGIVTALSINSARAGDTEGDISIVARAAAEGVAMTAVEAADEVQTFAFTSIPASQPLAVRKTGTTELSADFTLTGSSGTQRASLKAALEEIYGTTWTVTGSLTSATDADTGETLYSGTLTATASGDISETNVPQAEIVSGEVQTYVVTGGDGDSDYGYGASTGAALGFTEGDFQTAIRGTGGVKAGVVVKGSSTAPIPGTPVAPVHVSTVESGTAVTSGNLTWSHTVAAGSNRYLVVSVMVRPEGGAVSGVTYAGTPMTLLGTDTDGSWIRGYVYGLVAPAVGTANVVATITGQSHCVGVSSDYTGVDQSTPLSGTVSISDDTSPSHQVTTSVANSIVYSALFTDNDAASGTSGQTELAKTAPDGVAAGMTTWQELAATATTYTETFSNGGQPYRLVMTPLRGIAPAPADGEAFFRIYYEVSRGNVTAGAAAGTGAVVSTIQNGGTLATGVSTATTPQGSDGEALFLAPKPILPGHWRVYLASSLSDLDSAPTALDVTEEHSFGVSEVAAIRWSEDGSTSFTTHADQIPTVECSLVVPVGGSEEAALVAGSLAWPSGAKWLGFHATSPDGLYALYIDIYGSVSEAPTYGDENNVWRRTFQLDHLINPDEGYSLRITVKTPV